MYLDPALGGMLLQAVVAIIAVGGGLLFSFRKKIRAMFSKDEEVKRKENMEVTDDAIDTLADGTLADDILSDDILSNDTISNDTISDDVLADEKE